MATLIVDDISPRIQFIALPDQTIFIYPFVIFKDSDLVVFKTPNGQAASDTADILQLTIDYVVSGVGNSDGGTIILTNPAVGGDIITIERDAPIERTTNFTPGSFTTEQMNDALNSQVTFSQDNEMISEAITPKYQESDLILPGQVILPKLGDGEFWIGSPTASGISKAQLDQAPDCADLRTDLAVEAEFIDGARIVGYFDDNPISGVGPTTVRDALSKVIDAVIVPVGEQISANNNIVLGGDFSTNPFQEGESFTSTEIGLARYIADGWGIQLDGSMRVSTKKDLNDPVPIGTSNVFSDASMEITVVTPQASIGVDDRGVLDQPIEGYYWRDVAQRTFFVSFYVRSSVIGTYCMAIVNNSADTSFVKEYTVDAPNQWKQIIIEVSPSPVLGGWGDFKTDRAVTFIFTLAAGTNSQQAEGSWIAGGNKIATVNQVNFFASGGNTFNIDLIQMEPAKVTPFEMRPQQQEIAFAQRYFEKSYNIETIPGAPTVVGVLRNVIAVFPDGQETWYTFQKTFATSKRITPIMNWFSPVTGQINTVNLIGTGDLVAIPIDPGETTTGGVGTGPVAIESITLEGHFTANARMPL